MLTSDESNRVEIFKDTYNAMYLKGFPIQKLNYVQSNSNPIQKKLIENLKSIKSSTFDVEFIEGPVGIRKFKMVFDGKPKKSIYLFGEYHVDTKGHCLSKKAIGFDEYIHRLSLQTPAFFDVYVELPMVKSIMRGKINSKIIFQKIVILMFKSNTVDFMKMYKKLITKYHKDTVKSPATTGYMFSKLKNRFKECIQPGTRMIEKCQLMRFHNVNIRSTWDVQIDNSMVNPTDIYTEDVCMNLIHVILGNGLKTGKSSDEIINVVKKITLYLPSFLSMLKILIKDDKINLYDVFCKNKWFKKELKASSKKEEIIKWLMVMSYKKVRDIGTKVFITEIKNLISSIENDTAIELKSLTHLSSIFIHMNGLLLDSYCLSRIFKVHNLKKNVPLIEFQPEESKNIIVYVGDAHARNMYEFFRFIGFKDTYSFYDNKKNGCVNMKKGNVINIHSPYVFKTPAKNISPKISHNLSPNLSPNLSLKKEKVIQLRLIAKKMNLKGYSKLNKTNLINLILETKKVSDNSKSLQNQTVVQLKIIAKKIGLTGFSKMKKEQLINTIINYNKDG